MDKKKLEEANRLNQLIEDHEKALKCFEYDKNEHKNWHREDQGEELLPSQYESTNPKLIIEFDAFDDDWYREQIAIPMSLSNFLIDTIKAQVKENLEKLKSDFEEL